MPRYLSLHTLACLTRQGAEVLAARLARAEAFQVRCIAVNLTEGKMLVEYEAPGREEIEAWFAREKFHHDWLWRVEQEWREGKLEAVG
ncbi:MAG: hypothetical protein HYY26_04675 [Acidobacteria bacterium]|nr:hypothetical protein [Acidobacteriota bacterium]